MLKHIKTYKIFEMKGYELKNMSKQFSYYKVDKKEGDEKEGEFVVYHPYGGFLEFGVSNGMYFLEYVEVPEEERNQGIATNLLDLFFRYVKSKNGLFDMTGYLEDGEKYLHKVVDKMVKQYNIGKA